MMELKRKLKVAVLGATGMVGQRFLTILENHPWFDVAVLAASPRSAGKTYEEAVGARWKLDIPMPEKYKKMIVVNVNEVDAVSAQVDFCFSAVDMSKDEIRAIEEDYAKHETPVVSNNSAHRWTPDVPMVIPEINPEHYEIIKSQKQRLGTTRGFIAVKPNCSIQSYTPALAAWKEFEPYEMIVTTYQAISGAGKNFKEWPEMVGNVIKASEPKISAQCIRIPVLNGHTAAAFVKFRKPATKEVLIEKLEGFYGIPQQLRLPSAPKRFIQYLQEDNRPQVTLDVDYEGGMGVSIGRLRQDSIYDWKFVGLSHNTLRGAAGGAVESAECLTALEYITAKEELN